MEGTLTFAAQPTSSTYLPRWVGILGGVLMVGTIRHLRYTRYSGIRYVSVPMYYAVGASPSVHSLTPSNHSSHLPKVRNGVALTTGGSLASSFSHYPPYPYPAKDKLSSSASPTQRPRGRAELATKHGNKTSKRYGKWYVMSSFFRPHQLDVVFLPRQPSLSTFLLYPAVTCRFCHLFDLTDRC